MPDTLRKRLATSVPLKLELKDDGGKEFTRNFRLCFDFNAITMVEELTGYSLLSGEIWKHCSAKVLSLLFWAAVLAHHPEYDTKDDAGRPTSEGLEVIRSYMDAGNSPQIINALQEAFVASLPKEDQERIRREQERAKKEGKQDPVPTPAAPEPAAAATGSGSA